MTDDLRPGGRFDRFVAQLAAEDKFSGTVLLTCRDKPVLARSYGMANKEKQIPNGPDTIFGLASVNKLFTGAAVAQLAQRGRIAYRAKLGDYLDGFPSEVAGTVTVHHLLTHTSGVGLPSSNPEPPPGSEDWETVEDVWNGTLAYLRALPLRFTPGTDYQYSNDGYFLLAAIVAEVSGQPFLDYLHEHVFAPAGMTSTGVYTREQRLGDPRIAHSYRADESGKLVDITGQIPIWKSAGDPYSTAPDLTRFVQALRDNALLDPAYTSLTVSPKISLSADHEIKFGTYAPGATLSNGQWILGHNGATGANVDWFPDSGWTAVVLTNYDGASKPVVALARDLITKH